MSDNAINDSIILIWHDLKYLNWDILKKKYTYYFPLFLFTFYQCNYNKPKPLIIKII